MELGRRPFEDNFRHLVKDTTREVQHWFKRTTKLWEINLLGSVYSLSVQTLGQADVALGVTRIRVANRSGECRHECRGEDGESNSGGETHIGGRTSGKVSKIGAVVSELRVVERVVKKKGV